MLSELPQHSRHIIDPSRRDSLNVATTVLLLLRVILCLLLVQHGSVSVIAAKHFIILRVLVTAVISVVAMIIL